MKGQDQLEDQDIKYKERTQLSKDFSEGTVELTLRGVTFSDEGPYYCRAVNDRGHGDQKVQLTINELNAEEPMVTVAHIDGKKRLKCIETGAFRVPEVRWYDREGKDLSAHVTHNITVLGDGRMRVESVLDLDVETNAHYFCQVKEGRLKRTARAVISDGEPVTVTDTNLPE
ncbi:PREDICTED: butyrophilin-like protein 8 [Nanorana parkeri]|uniref:butyrophilin-like protein 8 n=1 Tax=Nanorana parkeri TaxID=125878 RepID=UPI00085479FE|nr:PREDICTED: butyrophilin-like protein 8 [Nanorana parkeri]